MSIEGAHLREALSDLEFRKEECRRKAHDETIRAETFEQCERILRRALKEEEAKVEAQCIAELN